MSVSNENYKDKYTGIGATGPYPITFPVTLDDGGNAKDVLVLLQDDTGAETDITSTSTISGLNVSTDVSYDSTYTIVLVRRPTLTQPYTFPYLTKFPSQSFEDALDRLTFLAQRLAFEQDQSLKAALSDDTIDRLPTALNRASKFLAFDVDGQPLAALGMSSVPVTSWAATLLDDIDLAMALTTLGISTFSHGLLVSTDKAAFMREAGIVPVWNGKVEVLGSGLSIAGLGAPSLAALNGTDVAFIDATLEELRCYRFNGSTWSLVGSALSIPGIGSPSLAALNGTDVAFIDSTLDELRCYRFNGSTWSLIGSGFSIPGVGDRPSLAALNGTDVAFIDATLEELRCYRFNGSTWSLVGSALSIPGFSQQSLTALSGTDVAFVAVTIGELRRYRFDGSAWSIVGSGLSITGISYPALASVSDIDVMFHDDSNSQFRCYRFDFVTETWSLTDGGPLLSGAYRPALAAMNATDIAFIDGNIEQLRCYRFGIVAAGPYHP